MKKLSLSEANKIISPLHSTFGPTEGDTLTAWMSLYLQLHVHGAPLQTQQAKRGDLEAFLQFFRRELHSEALDLWTPALTKYFQQQLTTILSSTGKPYKTTTINRRLATLRHFARWLLAQRPLLAGDPFAGVKDRQLDEPDWRGLSARQLLRLKSACEQRINACRRADQNPLLEVAVFYVLLQTGLRESELVALNIHQYHHKGLHQVLRVKNKRITTKVPLAAEAREALDQYLATRPIPLPEEPLFLSRVGQRLQGQTVHRICLRIVKQAQAYLPDDEKFRFTPHMLRHTFLKRVTDKHGVHFAQQMSGNVSIREIFRYAKPSQDEIDETVEGLFQ